MPLKKTTQDVVQQLAGVDRLQIKRRFTARFKFEHSLPKKAVTTVAIDTQSTRTMDKLSTKPLPQQRQQMRVGNRAVVGPKPWPGALALDLNATQSRAAQEPVVTRQSQQSLDLRLR